MKCVYADSCHCLTSVVMKIHLILLATVMVLLTSCSKDPMAERAFEVAIPANFPEMKHEVKFTKEGFNLGKKLFYDPILSRDNTISCGSCHQQHVAFSHADHRFSHGIDNQLGKRNATSLQNLMWNQDFFWDGGVHDMGQIPFNPIQNPVEMDEDLAVLLQKLRANDEYRRMFKSAYKEDTINLAYFTDALSQFMGALISGNSRYDKYIRGEGGQLSEKELRGLTTFKAKCSSCHATDLFTDNSFRNNGISTSIESDKGHYEIVLLPQYKGAFKVPTLRNIEKTGPYMHTGSFNTLEEVLKHYAQGVKQTETLDKALIKEDGSLGIELNETEQAEIIAFLKTLTDDEFLNNKSFSE